METGDTGDLERVEPLDGDNRQSAVPWPHLTSEECCHLAPGIIATTVSTARETECWSEECE